MSEELAGYTETFGDYLKRHREASGKGLDEISRTTKISKRYLEAFEANDLKNLPDEAFARGFLKNYAAEIGLDMEECLDRYERFRRSTMPTQVKEMKRPPSTPSFLLGEGGSGIQAARWLPIAFGLVIFGGLIALSIWFFGTRSESDESVAREPAQIVIEEEAGTEENPVGADDGFAAPIAPSILTLRASETTTVLLRVDEAAAQEVVIEKGEEKSFEVQRQIEIRNLNQNRLKLEYNGRPIEAAGPVIKLFNQNMFSK